MLIFSYELLVDVHFEGFQLTHVTDEPPESEVDGKLNPIPPELATNPWVRDVPKLMRRPSQFFSQAE